MNMYERQSAILNLLFRDRYTTEKELAAMLGVSERTIRKDIAAIVCKLPVKTVRGRYNSGVWLEDWFIPDANKLSSKQENLLTRLRIPLTGEDLIVMNSILTQFTRVSSFKITRQFRLMHSSASPPQPQSPRSFSPDLRLSHNAQSL